ncbi:MAG: hypothetical protein IT252_11160 [Chitinophagaceae bacterium]|nr:hypothetical protein [Chitinophagaceae bacterium]
MKAILLSLSFFGMAATALATVHTVSNDPATVAQFSNLQTAIDAAASGDTIFIHGSPVSYPSFNLTDKRLAIIGPGFAPDKELTATVRIAGGFIRNTAATGSASGTELSGLVFTTILRIADAFGGSEAVNNVLIQRCQFNSTINIGYGGISIGNYLFEGNYFNGSGIDGAGVSASYSNFIWRNNVFRNALNGRCFGFFESTANMLIDHNLFYTSSASLTVFNTCSNFLITNNVFVKSNAAGASNSVFNNNLTFNTPNNTPWTVNNNVDGGGNVTNLDPQMADQASVNTGTDNPLLNFTIAAGPANTSGSDGKDMGLLFDATGTANWANSRNSRLPRVTKMNILNPTVSPNGTLNVQVEAKVSN